LKKHIGRITSNELKIVEKCEGKILQQKGILGESRSLKMFTLANPRANANFAIQVSSKLFQGFFCLKLCYGNTPQ
jgi:hypothetical protein